MLILVVELIVVFALARSYYKLGREIGKNKWFFGFLGIVVYYFFAVIGVLLIVYLLKLGVLNNPFYWYNPVIVTYAMIFSIVCTTLLNILIASRYNTDKEELDENILDHDTFE